MVTFIANSDGIGTGIYVIVPMYPCLPSLQTYGAIPGVSNEDCTSVIANMEAPFWSVRHKILIQSSLKSSDLYIPF